MSTHWTSLSPGLTKGADLAAPELSQEGGLEGVEIIKAPQNLRYSPVRETESLMTGVFEWEGSVTRWTSFPSDELVKILAGEAIFTSPDGQSVQSFAAGEWFLVPGGWRGDWGGEALYREFAIVPPVRWNAMFDDSAKSELVERPAPSLVVAVSQKIASLTVGSSGGGNDEPRTVTLHSGDLVVELVSAPAMSNTAHSSPDVDQVVSVIEGTATIRSADGSSEALEKGTSAVVHGSSVTSVTVGAGSTVLFAFAPKAGAVPAHEDEVSK